MTIEERLEKLERKIEEMQTVIRTKTLCVLDDQGQERIKLVVDNDEPMLIMLDANGKPRALMTVVKDGPSRELRMTTVNGKNALLHVFKDGPGLVLFDANGHRRACLNIDKTGPRLELENEDEFTSATLRVSDDKPVLVLNMYVKGTFFDQSSQVYLCVDKTGSLLDMSDSTGKTCVRLVADKDGPGLTLLDAKENPIWKAP